MTQSIQPVTLTKKSVWSFFFRFGFYDPTLPINYDRSIEAAFKALDPDPTDRIIDVGCGNGRLMHYAQSWLKSDGKLFGVEISQGGAEAAKLRSEQLNVTDKVTIQQGNMLDLSKMNIGLFDRAVAHFTVYMLNSQEDRRKAIHEIAAVLKPGGRFVFAVPSESWSVPTIFADARQIESQRTDISFLYKNFRNWFIYSLTWLGFRDLERGLDQDFFHRYTTQEIIEHLSSAGFENIQIQNIYAGCGYRAVAQKRI
jgi:ubiquinone/menaquinone biosynthesis C-methylase UbiE